MQDQRNWFSQARFGIFIHFGLYSLMGGNENYYHEMDPLSYRKRLFPQFNPEQFDADEWAARIRDSGARYAVITTKHGEGFCLFHTKATDFHIGNTPFRRDLVLELADAVRNTGLRFGIYHAADNWYYRESGKFEQTKEAYTAFVTKQLEELTGSYGRIDLLWLDGSSEQLPPDQLAVILDKCRDRQPSMVINDRGVNHQTVNGHLGDFITPERFFPEKYDIQQNTGKIEICDAMGLKGWGFHKDQHFHSSPELIYRLCLSRSMGANYLLNVEPQPDGRIRPECTVRLSDIGSWIRDYDFSVSDVQPGNALVYEEYEQQRNPIGCTVKKDRSLFVHLSRWPRGDRVLIDGVSGEPERCGIFRKETGLPVNRQDGVIKIKDLPSLPPGTNPVLEIDFSAPPEITRVYALPAPRVRVESRFPTLVPAEAAELIPAPGEVTWHCHKRYLNGSRSVGRWVKRGLAAEWKLSVEQAGNYRIIAYLGTTAEQAGALGVFTSGTESVSFVSVPAGEYTEPYGLDAGIIRLEAGDRILQLTSEKMKQFFPDVHHLILIPQR